MLEVVKRKPEGDIAIVPAKHSAANRIRQQIASLFGYGGGSRDMNSFLVPTASPQGRLAPSSRSAGAMLGRAPGETR